MHTQQQLGETTRLVASLGNFSREKISHEISQVSIGINKTNFPNVPASLRETSERRWQTDNLKTIFKNGSQLSSGLNLDDSACDEEKSQEMGFSISNQSASRGKRQKSQQTDSELFNLTPIDKSRRNVTAYPPTNIEDCLGFNSQSRAEMSVQS